VSGCSCTTRVSFGPTESAEQVDARVPSAAPREIEIVQLRDDEGHSIDIQAYCTKSLPGSVADDSNRDARPYGWQCLTEEEAVGVDLYKICQANGMVLGEVTSGRRSYRFRCVAQE
jgi:hypothetical protein